MNVAVHQLKLSNYESLIHGAHLILLDGLGIGSSSTSATAIKSLRNEAFVKLLEIIPERPRMEILDKDSMHSTNFVDDSLHFGTSLFKVRKGDHIVPFPYSIKAPTTATNALRVLRALQLRKPVLLEGSPGVGKTSLISALASATGHRLVRINLSEHTDLMDLLGTDLPVEGGKPGEFQWCDGVFLRALKVTHCYNKVYSFFTGRRLGTFG
jgi:midasin